MHYIWCMTIRLDITPDQQFDGAKNSVDDILSTADFMWHKTLLERRLWPEIESDAAGVASVFMAQAIRDNVDIDVSSFAAMLGKTRPTVHRMLQRWESLGYCTMTRVGRRTLVAPTEAMRVRSREYLDTLTTLRYANQRAVAE